VSLDLKTYIQRERFDPVSKKMKAVLMENKSLQVGGEMRRDAQIQTEKEKKYEIGGSESGPKLPSRAMGTQTRREGGLKKMITRGAKGLNQSSMRSARGSQAGGKFKTAGEVETAGKTQQKESVLLQRNGYVF